MTNSITIDARQVLDALNYLLNQAEDLTPALNAIGGSLKSKIQGIFRTSTSPSGQRWAPLKFRQGQPLVDRGNLRDSIDYQVSGGDTVEIGTNYGRLPGGGSVAAVHQFGATIRPRRGRHLVFTPRGFTHPIFARQVTIPARQFLPTDGLPEEWEANILDILARHFQP